MIFRTSQGGICSNPWRVIGLLTWNPTYGCHGSFDGAVTGDFWWDPPASCRRGWLFWWRMGCKRFHLTTAHFFFFSQIASAYRDSYFKYRGEGFADFLDSLWWVVSSEVSYYVQLVVCIGECMQVFCIRFGRQQVSAMQWCKTFLLCLLLLCFLK